MLSKSFHLDFCKGFLKVLDTGYVVDDASDITVKYNHEKGRLDYCIRVGRYDKEFAQTLCREVGYFCKVGYEWVGFNAVGRVDLKDIKDGTKAPGSVKLYLAIYPIEKVPNTILKNRSNKMNGSCGKDSPFGIIYNRVIDDIDKILSKKEYVVSYKTKTGSVCKEVIYAYTPDEAFAKFYETYSQYKEGVDFFDVSLFEQGNFDDMVIEPEPKMVWSDSFDEKVVAGFTITEEGIKKHYTWNDDDCVYYWDESDEDSYMEVPRGAILDE